MARPTPQLIEPVRPESYPSTTADLIAEIFGASVSLGNRLHPRTAPVPGAREGGPSSTSSSTTSGSRRRISPWPPPAGSTQALGSVGEAPARVSKGIG